MNNRHLSRTHIHLIAELVAGGMSYSEYLRMCGELAFATGGDVEKIKDAVWSHYNVQFSDGRTAA